MDIISSAGKKGGRSDVLTPMLFKICLLGCDNVSAFRRTVVASSSGSRWIFLHCFYTEAGGTTVFRNVKYHSTTGCHMPRRLWPLVPKISELFWTISINPKWETLASRRKTACIGALYKAYCGERAWKDIGNKLERLHYLSRADHNRKTGSRRQRTDRGKYWLVNRTIEGLEQVGCSSARTAPMQLNCV